MLVLLSLFMLHPPALAVLLSEAETIRSLRVQLRETAAGGGSRWAGAGLSFAWGALCKARVCCVLGPRPSQAPSSALPGGRSQWLSALGFSSVQLCRCGTAPFGGPPLLTRGTHGPQCLFPSRPSCPELSEGICEPYPAFLQVPSQLPLSTRGELPLQPAHTPSPGAQIPGQPRSSLPPVTPGQQPWPASPCPPLVRPHTPRLPPLSPLCRPARFACTCPPFAPSSLCHVPSVGAELTCLQRKRPQGPWAGCPLDVPHVTSCGRTLVSRPSSDVSLPPLAPPVWGGDGGSSGRPRSPSPPPRWLRAHAVPGS